jgi:hypothetical protein
MRNSLTSGGTIELKTCKSARNTTLAPMEWTCPMTVLDTPDLVRGSVDRSRDFDMAIGTAEIGIHVDRDQVPGRPGGTTAQGSGKMVPEVGLEPTRAVRPGGF